MNLRAAHRKASACSANNENWQGDPAVFIYDLLPLLALVRNSSLTITILLELGTVLRNPTAPWGRSLARVQLATDWHGCWNFHMFSFYLFLYLIHKAVCSFSMFVCSDKHPSEVFRNFIRSQLTDLLFFLFFGGLMNSSEDEMSCGLIVPSARSS